MPRRAWRIRDPVMVAWMVGVAAVYLGATLALAHAAAPRLDRAMQLAVNLTEGRFDLGPVARMNDIVVLNGRNYQAISPLPIAPYLAFVPFRGLWEASRWIIPAVLGMIAAWLCLLVARRYGPPGAPTIWLAGLGAFGTLLLTQSVRGNFYYLAHVEAVLFTLVALLEWKGGRRPWVLGLAFALAGLARPTVLLALLPFGIAATMASPHRLRALAGLAIPVVAAVTVTMLYDFARFGSVLETGYGISTVSASLQARRAIGLFSMRHLPDNIALFLAHGFDVRSKFPYLVPDQNGHSFLLTSPALLAAVGAPLRSRTVQVLWGAAILVAVPVFLYYGGGGAETYGYRYALDFIPFLFALTCIAARSRFGALEKLLVVLSCAFVGYGLVWFKFG